MKGTYAVCLARKKRIQLDGQDLNCVVYSFAAVTWQSVDFPIFEFNDPKKHDPSPLLRIS